MFSQKFVAVLSVVALLLPAALPLTLVAENQTPNVVINELLWMGSPASSADEWIELRNMTDIAVDISGWKLTRKSSGQEVTMLTIPAEKTIEAHGYFLISNFAMSSASTQLAIDPDVVDTAVSLLNSGLEVKLYDATGALVDVVDDGSGTPLAGKYVSGQEYASMARNGIPGDGTKPERWHTTTTSVNLKTDSIIKGTPRAANDNVPPVVPSIANTETVVGTPTTFDASDASDPDGDAMSITWNFGDGSTSDAVSPTHTYAAAGIYQVSLEIKDGTASAVASFTVTATAATVGIEQAAPTPIVRTNGKVIINEIFANPDGADDGEFVELVVSVDSADISRWTLNDESGTTYKFPSAAAVSSGAFVVAARLDTKIALNNSGDTVTLKDASGKVVDEVKFAEAEEGAAYAWDGSRWQWTTKPTPGVANEFLKPNHGPEAKFSVSTKRRAGEAITFDASDSTDVDGDALTYVWDFGDGTKGTGKVAKHVYAQAGAVNAQLTVRDPLGLLDVVTRDLTVRPPLKTPVTSSQPNKPKGKVKGTAIARSITEAQSAESSSDIYITGVVSAAPNVLGDGVLYVTDGTLGIAVRSMTSLPQLALGDAVEVRGKRRTKNSEAYVLVEERSGISQRGSGNIPGPKTLDASSIDSDDVGSLVRIVGEVTTLSGSRFALDDGSGEVNVYVRASTGFKRPALRSGDRVEVAGILSRTSSGIRLLPRMKDDIRVVSHVVPPVQRTEVPPAPKPAVWMYVAVAGALVLGAGVGMWRRKV